MNKRLLLSVLSAAVTLCAAAQEFNPIPRSWKWLSADEVIFSYDGTYTDQEAFSVNPRTGKRTEDDYKMEFCTSVEGVTSQNGTVLIKTFRDGELLHSGTVSYDENDQWTYGE